MDYARHRDVRTINIVCLLWPIGWDEEVEDEALYDDEEAFYDARDEVVEERVERYIMFSSN